MTTLSRKIFQVALISALASPLSLLAADKPAIDHDSHHPAQVPAKMMNEDAAQNSTSQLRENMHARMLAMRNTSDPEARQAMMMAQMADMSTMMAGMGSDCPMAHGMMKGKKGGMMGKSSN